MKFDERVEDFTTRKNRLIADFINLQISFRECNHPLDPVDYETVINVPNELKHLDFEFLYLSELPYEALKFNTSYDWIMAVVQKIESLGFNTNIQYRPSATGMFHQMVITKISVEDDAEYVVGETLTTLEWIEEAEKYTKLEAIHEAVYHFLIWYNKQSK